MSIRASNTLDQTDVTRSILAMRGITDELEVFQFAQGKFSQCAEIVDKTLVASIKEMLSPSNKIVIFGDYDADGVTAAAIAKLYVPHASVIIPERAMGYGLTDAALDAIPHDTDVVLTVDCGITAIEQIDELKRRGTGVIVTDHHEIQGKIPDCIVVHPTRSKCALKQYSGSGVAYKLMNQLFGDLPSIRGYGVQLAAIGTICDVMPVTGENREIIKDGLRMMMMRPLPGVKALFYALRADHRGASESFIAFSLGPTLNACGRLGNARLAYEILASSNFNSAVSLAKDAVKLNNERKSITSSAAEKLNILSEGPVIIAEAEGRHRGSIGLIASKIANKRRLPVIVIVADEDNRVVYGSIRGYGEFNCSEFIDYCGSCLTTGGGHKGAAGFSAPLEHVSCLIECAETFASGMTFTNSQESVYDFYANLDVVPSIYKSVFALAPYGNAFEQPTFVCRGKLTGIRYLGNSNKHAALTIDDWQEVLMFNLDAELPEINSNVTIAYTVSKPKTLDVDYELIGTEIEVNND